jgi:enoyl-CoA hydratase/2-(1,2-epoxy-1,2-dihydrophenyl)acetyl-CoA isomerase
VVEGGRHVQAGTPKARQVPMPTCTARKETSMTPYQTICYERDGDIGVLTLARPEKRNAQNPLMWQELRDLGADLSKDDTLRCLLVNGQGPTFSAGIDLVEGLAGAVADATENLAQHTHEEAVETAGTFRWIPDLDCPSVAAVHGHAYGAGLQLAVACDFRILAQSAKVGLIETRFGILPDMGATVRLPRIIGEGRARELILLGEVIGADEALRIGLANRVVPDDELASSSLDLARRLAAQPPLALQGARRALDAAWYKNADDSFMVALEAQLRCLASEDFKEGLEALAAGRPPLWRGR